MVRIKEDKLIIEIDCNGSVPLGILADFKQGLLNLIELIEINGESGEVEEVMKWGLMQTTRLIKQMSLSSDQLSSLNETMTEKQVTEFNKR